MLNVVDADLNVNPLTVAEGKSPTSKKTSNIAKPSRQGHNANVSPFRMAALHAVEAGYSPLPLAGKRPILEAWSDYCDAPLSAAQLSKIFRENVKSGIGVACGHRDLVAVDFDTENEAIIKVAREVFPESVVAKRGMKGRTDLYFTDGATISNRKFYGTDKKPFLEVLSRGSQTVIPGTIHPDTGLPYQWLTSRTIFDTPPEELTICNADAVEYLEAEFERRGWLYKKVETFKGESFKPRTDLGPILDLERRRYEGFALAKIDARVKHLSGMGKGGRNREAFALTCAAGRFVHHGIISREILEASIIDACNANGLNKENGINDLKATIERGLGYSRNDELPQLADRRVSVPAPPAKRAEEEVKDEVIARRRQPNLILSATGIPKPVLKNAVELLETHEDWDGVLFFDEFAHRAVALRRTPWCRKDPDAHGRHWTSNDDLRMTEWLQEKGILVEVKTAAQAVQASAIRRPFHPVKEYLSPLKWDGVKRIHRLASAYFGAEETNLARKVSTCFMVSAVARIFEPGCKVDTVLIIEGNQGDCKSSGFKALAGRWFTDEIADLGSKDAAMQMQGVWLIEMSELDTLSRADVGRAKAFFSRSTDRFRPTYGARVEEFPRQCIFAGTTNKDDYLKDETGDRRFWPVRGGNVNVAAIERDRDQLWAEAVAVYQTGAQWWLSGEDAVQAAEAQRERYAGDPWTDVVERFVSMKSVITIADILTNALGIEKAKMDQVAQNRAARILKSMRDDEGKPAWDRKLKRVRGTSDRMWIYQRKVMCQDADHTGDN